MSAEWQFLTTLNERLSPLKDPVQIQDVAVQMLGDHLQVNRVHYTQIEGDDFVIVRSYVRGVAPLPPRGPIGLYGPAAEMLRRGEFIVVADVGSDPRLTETGRARLLKNEIAAFVGISLIKEGRWTA